MENTPILSKNKGDVAINGIWRTSLLFVYGTTRAEEKRKCGHLAYKQPVTNP